MKKQFLLLKCSMGLFFLIFNTFIALAQNNIFQLSPDGFQNAVEKMEIFLEMQQQQVKSDKGLQLVLVLKNQTQQEIIMDNPLHELNFILIGENKSKNIALLNRAMFQKIVHHPSEEAIIMNKSFSLEAITLNNTLLSDDILVSQTISIPTTGILKIDLNIPIVDGRTKSGDLKPNWGEKKIQSLQIGEYDFAVNCPIRIRNPEKENLFYRTTVIQLRYGL